MIILDPRKDPGACRSTTGDLGVVSPGRIGVCGGIPSKTYEKTLKFGYTRISSIFVSIFFASVAGRLARDNNI